METHVHSSQGLHKNQVFYKLTTGTLKVHLQGCIWQMVIKEGVCPVQLWTFKALLLVEIVCFYWMAMNQSQGLFNFSYGQKHHIITWAAKKRQGFGFRTGNELYLVFRFQGHFILLDSLFQSRINLPNSLKGRKKKMYYQIHLIFFLKKAQTQKVNKEMLLVQVDGASFANPHFLLQYSQF